MTPSPDARRAAQKRKSAGQAGFGDAVLHVTAAELRELTQEVDALLARYEDRAADPTRRPPGTRTVQFIQMALPRGPVPPQDPRAEAGRD